jgi:hypothetical protein
MLIGFNNNPCPSPRGGGDCVNYGKFVAMGVVTLTSTQQNTRTWREMLVGKWEMKKLFGRLRSGWEYIIKIDLTEKV